MAYGIPAFLTDPHRIALLCAIAGAASAIAVTAAPWISPDPLARRIKAVGVERERIRAREREKLAAADKRSAVRMKPSRLAKQLVERFDLQRWLGVDTAKKNLAMAGFRGPGAEYAFLAFRMIAPIAFFLITLTYVFLVIKWSQPFFIKLGAAIAAAYLGIQAPTLFLKNTIVKRKKALERAYPNALDLLLICVESGMSIELAARRVSQEIGIESILMAEEMGLLAAEMSYLAERRIAFENLAARTGLEFDPRAHHCARTGRALRHAAWRGLARACPGKSRPAYDGCREEGRGAAADADCADDPVFPSRPVRRHPVARGDPDQSLALRARPPRNRTGRQSAARRPP